MLKPVRKKRESKQIVSEQKFTSNSNFKTGSIVISNKQIRTQSLNRLSQLSAFPQENEQIRIVTKNAVNSFDFILAVIEKEKRIEKLYIAFYRIGKKTVTELRELQIAKKIGDIIFIINDGFPKLVPDAYNLLKSFEGGEGVEN